MRWVPDPPEAPASLSVDAVDGGFTLLSWPAATPDPLSGISSYHVDGAVLFLMLWLGRGRLRQRGRARPAPGTP